MTKILHLSQILIYYDIPEVFIAKDEVGTNFLCLLVSVEQNDIKYISTAISSARLAEFINGNVDLRDIYTIPETNQYYYFDQITESINATIWEKDGLPEEYLPDSGFIYKKPLEDNKLILNESLDKNNAIIHLAVSDINDNYSIDADDLGDIVKLYQVIIEHSFKKKIEQIQLKDKKSFIIPQNYKLRAFASSYSSFNVHLYSTAYVNLFGVSIIELALSKFDELSRDFVNQDEYIESLRSIKGHTVSTFKKLIKKLIDRDITIKHKWYSPGQEEVHFSLIDKFKAEKIYNILTLTEELAEEKKTFEGYFVQADVEKGTWRIVNKEDEKEYNGESNGTLLQGIIIETMSYRLTCIEIIEELKIAEKEKTRYILKVVEEIE
jgi:hypothetical protein